MSPIVTPVTVDTLRRLAAEVGIDVVGAAPAEPYETTERHIHERRERGLFGNLRFTMARPEVSCHPERALPDARTVVAAARCYWEPGREPGPGEGRMPRYAWRDHYSALRVSLEALGARLGGTYRVLVDDNAHVDREAAARAGIGFYGKNTMLITRGHGSWVVLGTLVTDVAIEASEPARPGCGACTLCIDACPTDALVEPGVLDATRCLSTATQTAGALDDELMDALGDRIYGCDICQDVCPWNVRTRREVPADTKGLRSRLAPRRSWRAPDLAWILTLGEQAWRAATRGTALRRAKRRSLLRNALIAAGNSGDAGLLPLVRAHASAGDPCLEEHARWALVRLERTGSDGSPE
jgi:epoxyqueuosine reductase